MRKIILYIDNGNIWRYVSRIFVESRIELIENILVLNVTTALFARIYLVICTYSKNARLFMSSEWQEKYANKFVETKGKVLTTRKY